MIWISSIGFSPKSAWAVIFLFLGTAVMAVSGCSTIEVKAPPSNVKAFFVAGSKANLLALKSLSPNCVDLSAYDQQIGVRYPPTLKVDILRKPPARPYKVFAVLEYNASEGLMEGLRNKAREIGADALILCHADTNQGLLGAYQTQRMQAVAIKYKLTGESDQDGKL
jgi:hypothetical protein